MIRIFKGKKRKEGKRWYEWGADGGLKEGGGNKKREKKQDPK